MPDKLDRCVSDVKAEGSADNPWAVCNAAIGKESKTQEKDYPWGQCISDQAKAGKDKDSANKICGSIKAKYAESIIQEKINANRQVPFFNPPITNQKVKPKIEKTKKGIGGQVGKIDSSSNTNNMTTDLWKKIFDTQLRRNVKEPRY